MPFGSKATLSARIRSSSTAGLTPRRGEVLGRCPGARALAVGHFGDGNVDYNIAQPIDIPKAELLARWQELAHAVDEVALAFGCSISAEHGIGQMKRQELACRAGSRENGGRLARRRPAPRPELVRPRPSSHSRPHRRRARAPAARGTAGSRRVSVSGHRPGRYFSLGARPVRRAREQARARGRPSSTEPGLSTMAVRPAYSSRHSRKWESWAAGSVSTCAGPTMAARRCMSSAVGTAGHIMALHAG
jgi:hypothetical protein